MIALPTRRRQRQRVSSLRRREALAGLLFVLPWMVSLLLFTVYPIIATIFFSFTDYNIIQAPHWVGLANYQTMFTSDPDFWHSVGNSGYYALISVPLGLIVALLLALLLNMRARGIGIYRTIFYLPTLVPPVASTIIFMLLFNPNSSGFVNVVLGAIGIQSQGWLTDANQAKPVLIFLSLWGLGAATLIFLAGLKDIPMTLLEAATIDGADPWQRFWHITLPLLSPVLLFNLVMGVISSFQVFTQALIVGGTTGDPQGSTLMFMVMIYRSAFRYFSMGYASALSVILFLAVLIVTLLIFWSARVWVFYEGGRS